MAQKSLRGISTKVGSSMSGVGENFVVNKNNMDPLKLQLEKALREVPNFDMLKDHMEMTTTNEGLRIELMEPAEETFGDIGSPTLNQDGRDIVIVPAQEFGKLPNRLAIEGRMDAECYFKRNHYTNWELSADRAHAAR